MAIMYKVCHIFDTDMNSKNEVRHGIDKSVLKERYAMYRVFILFYQISIVNNLAPSEPILTILVSMYA